MSSQRWMLKNGQFGPWFGGNLDKGHEKGCKGRCQRGRVDHREVRQRFGGGGRSDGRQYTRTLHASIQHSTATTAPTQEKKKNNNFHGWRFFSTGKKSNSDPIPALISPKSPTKLMTRFGLPDFRTTTPSPPPETDFKWRWKGPRPFSTTGSSCRHTTTSFTLA